ncbi:hypothetical protein GCM10010112_48660 [Actinoplanes lobatus]|uniref:DUF4132 domain-containing protein n=1 Tax=Actinoplanes lobatus TaxID=113568 RepID=A0A7W7HNZ5_9ACTN|nr:DUF4132 domain-containing protein [Actinoplanes lobatus]MBB4754026.1 hypothetical protein [Actinoplanes lobatus]GGN76486.1 hypothetical protein GCM10010112_48660 [Actinoplanes lobatus]GIE40918.1 hypothetical protein Alo02nite_38160 [Actinoplanes lobatus]
MLPNEDTWVLPTAWREGLHPRQGGIAVPAEAPGDAAELLTAHLASERAVRLREKRAQRPTTYNPDLYAVGQRHLAALGGDTDPIGAAVAVLLGAGRSGEHGRLLADLWVTRAGAAFAARAAVEATLLYAGGRLWRVDPDTTEDTYESVWRNDDLYGLYGNLKAVRAHLAAAPTGEYEQAVDVLAGYRSEPAGRIVTSYLAPTRTDWVDADCAAAADWVTDETRPLVSLLVLAASTTGHLEALHGVAPDTLFTFPRIAEAGTVLDGVGPAAAPYLDQRFYRDLFRFQDDRWRDRDRLPPPVIKLMAQIPTDDAFRIVLAAALDGARHRPGQLLKSGVLSRYPVRALRMLAERDDAVSCDLFGGIVLTRPELVPHLPAEIRGTAAELLESGGAGIGAGWAHLLDTANWQHPIDSADDEKRAVVALAAIPTEEALTLVVDRIDGKHYLPAFLTAAKRDPRLALRVLASRDSLGVLLRNHVLAYPGAVAEELPALDPAALARVEAITGPLSGGSGGAPPVLAGKLSRVPGLPEWLVVALLPAPALRDGGDRLPETAVRRLCELIALSKIGSPRLEIAEIRDLCEPRDLGVFAWAIFEQWRAAEFPPKNNLAMVALAALGDDTVVPELTALFPGWATASGRVRTGMDVLAAIGTDVALTHLSRLSRKARTEGFRRFARQRLDGVAVVRGLTPEQLADRIVPEFGPAVLDYGPRRFTIGFDEQLQPWVAGEDGRRLARLPRPAKTDDQTLAGEAYRRFTDLKKEAKTVGAERIRAIEEAMVTGRRWTGAEFRRFLVDHPFMWQLTQRLLWASFDGPFDQPGPVVFRAAEDRSFADLDDKAWNLDDAATVGVAHPWHFAADQPSWAEILTDYAIIQPFPQVGRELYTPSEVTLESFVGQPVTGRKLFTLSSLGWRFGHGHTSLERADTQIRYAPGYHWQDPDQPQHVTGVTTGDLDPVAYSEVARDLRYLTTA